MVDGAFRQKKKPLPPRFMNSSLYPMSDLLTDIQRVIFRINLDNWLKRYYVSQLYDPIT